VAATTVSADAVPGASSVLAASGVPGRSRFFVEDNNGATSGPDLTAALDDDLYALNAGDPEKSRYPKPATDYLDDWAHADAGWLRRFYPLGSDEVHNAESR